MSGTVYFVQGIGGGPIKIGYTSGDPVVRVRSMQTGSPDRLRVIASCSGDLLLEKDIHTSLRAHHVKGEWFEDCAEVRAVIREMTGWKRQKPRVKMRKCGCVPGWHFCEEAETAWRNVGLARAREDLELFGLAMKRFGDHITPRMASLPDEVAAKRQEHEAAA